MFSLPVSQVGYEPPINEVAIIAENIAKAMTKVHSRGVVHRDITSNNILLLGAGKVVIIDFGSAAFLDDEEEMRKVAGTAE